MITFQRQMALSHMDLTALDLLFEGDRARMKEWIGIYLEEAPPLFQRLSDSQAQGDVPGLTTAAHDLRPLAHYLGAPHMLELITIISHRARTEGAAACFDPVQELLAFGASAEMELRATLKDR